MKKAAAMVLLVFVAMMFVLPQEGECRRNKENLYEKLGDAREVNVYIDKVTDSSGQAGHMLESLRKKIENGLRTRQTINFVIVKNVDDADIIIDCDITERIWMETDPVDTPSIGGAVADAALSENYARMRADFKVSKGPRKIIFKRLRKKPLLWEEVVMATITKADMPEPESIPLIEDALVKEFIVECFGRSTGERGRAQTFLA